MSFIANVFASNTDDHPGKVDIDRYTLISSIRDASAVGSSLNKMKSLLDGYKER